VIVKMASSITNDRSWCPKSSENIFLQELHNLMIISFRGDSLDPFGHIINPHQNI